MTQKHGEILLITRGPCNIPILEAFPFIHMAIGDLGPAPWGTLSADGITVTFQTIPKQMASERNNSKNHIERGSLLTATCSSSSRNLTLYRSVPFESTSVAGDVRLENTFNRKTFNIDFEAFIEDLFQLVLFQYFFFVSFLFFPFLLFLLFLLICSSIIVFWHHLRTRWTHAEHSLNYRLGLTVI